MLTESALAQHEVWDRVLKKHVSEIGEVNYAALKSDHADLDAYVKWLGDVSPEKQAGHFPTKADELAYYINAYNAFTTAGAVKGYPVKSVRDLGIVFGFFRRDDHLMGGRKTSLADLENNIIRGERYREPRIHFAIVCASLSCPKLAREAFTGENLERLLAAGARQFINERRNVYVNGDTVTFSEILKWYQKDFKWSAPTVMDFVKAHADPALRAALDRLPADVRPKFFEYDWSINDPGSRARAKSEFEREISVVKR